MEPVKKKSPSRKLPFGGAWNQASWDAAKKRAKASLDPYCAICGGLIDMKGKAYAPNSCEVDHIIPISRGGHPYELTNLQLSHSRCNRRKGAKMDSDYTDKAVKHPIPLSNNW